MLTISTAWAQLPGLPTAPRMIQSDSVTSTGFIARVTFDSTIISQSFQWVYNTFPVIYMELSSDSTFGRIDRVTIIPRSAELCLKLYDTLRFSVANLSPGIAYYIRVRYWLPIIPLDMGEELSPFNTSRPSNTVTARLPNQSLPSIPWFKYPRMITSTGFTATWQPSSGNPDTYQVDVATDRTFRNIVTSRRVQDTAASITGLQPNTEYFYRVSATNRQGTSGYTRTVGERTLATPLPFSIDRYLAPTRFVQAGSRYYLYTTNRNISIAQADSIILALRQQRIALQDAWFQDTVTCSSLAIDKVPVLVVKIQGDSTRLLQAGFQNTGNWGFSSGSNYRYYYNFLPTSVQAVANSGLMLRCAPNPATEESMIEYVLPATANTTVEVQDILGRVITTVVRAQQAAGSYSVPLRTEGLAAGTYFVRLTARSTSGETLYKTVRMNVVR